MLHDSFLAPHIRIKEMKDSSENRVGSLRLLLALEGLALSIFLWGLAYKLSLYDPMQTSFRRIPQAKLLSSNERPATSEVLSNHDGSGPWSSAISIAIAGGLLLAGFAVACEFPVRRGSLLGSARNRRTWASTTLFSSILFRPPPARC